ncbi:MAG: cytochrome c oxidase subunit II [Deltaproteobacteria bacterium]|nr:cytochrome c oxidase subunit II [Myxococcales bacterium]MDP3214971.1 cytochrome c oxidase subunit II [Deltaproteobacteria bacterium]
MNSTDLMKQLPAQWSTFGPGYDWLFYFIYWMSVVLFVGIIGTAIYFVVKYRRQPGVKAEPTGHNLVMELAWTVAPVILLVLLFHWGFAGYVSLTTPPPDALDIRVRARKWSWDFEYPNGGHTANEVTIPVNRPVRFVLSSEDVLHAMFIPAFRVKRDAVPGMYTTLWFQATHTGDTRFYCAEYCGAADEPVTQPDGTQRETGHFSMGGLVHIVPQARWGGFLEGILRAPTHPDGREFTAAEWGEQLYTQQNCNTCHSVNGSPMTGPTWQHIFGHEAALTDGTRVTVDENYLRRSILEPNAQVVQGFNPVMPSYQGSLTDRQLDALIAYIRSLR